MPADGSSGAPGPAPTEVAPDRRYQPVPKEMLASGSPADLYVKRGQDFQLYYSQHAGDWDATLERMDRALIGTLWVADEDFSLVLAHVSEGVTRVAADISRDPVERGQLVSQHCYQALEEAYKHPSNLAAFGVAKATSESAVQALVDHPEILPGMALLLGHDYDTFSHSVCVAAFTVSLGLRVGISAPQEILAVGLGAMFHDFGKVRVPLAILTKPGPLTGWEMEVVRHHPEWGQALLEDLQATDVAMEPVLYHHERFNGTGYPAGLRREEIPFSARVAAVADVFHAITSRRPYRGPLDMYAAAELMVRRMPGHFDPDVLREFILLLGGGKRSAPGPSVGASG